MFEELYAKIPDVDAYLDRIGMKRADVTQDEAGLSALVRAQLSHIPFDDMDVWGAGHCPSLAIEDLFHKIIARRRGGYCFELNGLFCAFLNALGFDAYSVLVRGVENRDYLPLAAHCAVIVTINGVKYFTDVGYGGPAPYGAVAMDGRTHNGFLVGDEGEYRVLRRVEASGPVRAMLFRDQATPPVDFITPNFYVSQNPGSTFRARLSLNLRTPQGIYIVSDRSFKISRGGESQTRELRDLEDFKQVLRDYYGIDPAEAPIRDIFQ